MKKEKLIESLHPLERAVIPFLKQGITLNQLIEASNLKEVEVLRALHWLENKKALKLEEQAKQLVALDKNGHSYLKDGLPERRFLQVLKESMTLDKIKESSGLSQQEIEASIGILRRKQAISIEKGMLISITEAGKQLLTKQSLEEQFLSKLPLQLDSLSQEEKQIYNDLKKRHQIVSLADEKLITIHLTDLGHNLARSDLKVQNIIDSLTPEILKSKSWKDKKFRHYNLKISPPKLFYGKRHFVSQAVNYVRQIWIELGFKEMSGNMIQPSFWNFDALFTAQDHPVRELQDTFFIKNPKYSQLPSKQLVNKVKQQHESGWKYTWQEEEAKKNVLRTHTTVLSARTIAGLKHSDLPAKFFSISPCFRNEALDYSHLFEFHQVEGIVIDENANFRHLLGYLQEFYQKFGYKKIRLKPSFFPYTSPSLQIEVYDEKNKVWLEIGGAGIFRPEVVKPLLGKDIPVLAWGQGMARIIQDYYKLKDIRDLYKNDIQQLRNMPSLMI